MFNEVDSSSIDVLLFLLNGKNNANDLDYK